LSHQQFTFFIAYYSTSRVSILGISHFLRNVTFEPKNKKFIIFSLVVDYLEQEIVLHLQNFH
jgi:hypothetical protein